MALYALREHGKAYLRISAYLPVALDPRIRRIYYPGIAWGRQPEHVDVGRKDLVEKVTRMVLVQLDVLALETEVGY